MFKKYKKQLTISTLLILLPMIAGLVLWNRLPDSMSIHWGVDGQADGFGGKPFVVFFIPVMYIAMQLFMVWIIDLTNRDNKQSPKVINLIFYIMPVICLMNTGMLYSIGLGNEFDVNSIMPVSMGLLFTFIGNFLPKCTRNATIGIKVTWALNNEENWNATHRFAGKVWVAGGLLTLFSALLPTKIGYPIMFVALLGTAISSILYSYLYYRKQLKAGTAVPTKDIPMDKTTKAIFRVVRILVIVLLIGIGYMLFSGSIEYDFQDEALVMDPTFSTPITVRYETIEDIEYREGDVEGSRVGGYGSFRLLLGYFENEEFGTYNRCTYYKPESCIVLTVKGKTLVISGEDAAQTQTLYNQLLSKIPE